MGYSVESVLKEESVYCGKDLWNKKILSWEQKSGVMDQQSAESTGKKRQEQRY